MAATSLKSSHLFQINCRVASLSAAGKGGRVGGRKPALSESDMIIARAMLADKSIPVSEVAKRLKVGRTTLYKYFPGGKVY